MPPRCLTAMTWVLLLSACGRADPPPLAAAVLAELPRALPAPRLVTPIPTPEPEPEPAPARDVAACMRRLQVDGRRLAISWPGRLGQQVALSARVERALDLMQLVVRADGEQFLVIAATEAAWDGEELRLYTVLGRGLAHVRGGPQHLPQLMLVEDAACGADEILE